jgi:hypothetical protein
MIRVYLVVALTTLFVGFTALVIAFIVVDAGMVGEITRYGNLMTDDVAFARAEAMHNFSYLGGLIGIVTGGITIVQMRRRSIQRRMARRNQAISIRSELRPPESLTQSAWRLPTDLLFGSYFSR